MTGKKVYDYTVFSKICSSLGLYYPKARRVSVQAMRAADAAAARLSVRHTLRW